MQHAREQVSEPLQEHAKPSVKFTSARIPSAARPRVVAAQPMRMVAKTTQDYHIV